MQILVPQPVSSTRSGSRPPAASGQSALSPEYFTDAVRRLLQRAVRDKAHPSVIRHLSSVLEQTAS